MHEDKEKWNRKWQSDPGDPGPSSLVTTFLHLAAGRKALDIACGNGRNSLYLSSLGYEVDAVDISDVAVNRLKQKDSRIQAICADLDDWQVPWCTYDLILNIKFLDRNLFASIIDGLKPSGILFFESFVSPDPDTPYCLAENELLHAFSDLTIRFYEETENDPHDRFKMTVRMVAVKK